MPFLDLIQEGTWAIRAVEKFNYHKGFSLDLRDVGIRQAISRAIGRPVGTIRLPVHLVEQVKQAAAIRRELNQQLGREPLTRTASELDLTEERFAVDRPLA